MENSTGGGTAIEQNINFSTLHTYYTNDGNTIDGVLNKATLEIRVYN
jgi:hypothetical protein